MWFSLASVYCIVVVNKFFFFYTINFLLLRFDILLHFVSDVVFLLLRTSLAYSRPKFTSFIFHWILFVACWHFTSSCFQSRPSTSAFTHTIITLYCYGRSPGKGLQGLFVLGNESSRERTVPGTKVDGAGPAGNEKTWERMFLMPFSVQSLRLSSQKIVVRASVVIRSRTLTVPHFTITLKHYTFTSRFLWGLVF